MEKKDLLIAVLEQKMKPWVHLVSIMEVIKNLKESL